MTYGDKIWNFEVSNHVVGVNVFRHGEGSVPVIARPEFLVRIGAVGSRRDELIDKRPVVAADIDYSGSRRGPKNLPGNRQAVTRAPRLYIDSVCSSEPAGT